MSAGTKAWTTSHVENVQISFTWSIEKFSRLINAKKVLKVIRSPNFFSDSDEDTQWYLELYPRGREDHKDYISLFLTLDCTMQTEVFASYKLSVLNANGIGSHTFREEARFTEGDVRGKDQFITRSTVLDKSKSFCVNDTLTVECEVIASRVTHVSRHRKSVTDATETNLSEELSTLLGNVRFSDIVFHVKGREFPAHKAILAARSPAFLSMLDHESGDKRNQRIDVKDVEPEVFQQVLKYIYTAKVDHLETMAAPLLAIADKYDLNHLKTICEESLMNTMNPSNAGSIYMLADIHSAENLKAEALKLIQQQGGLGSIMSPKH